MIFKQFPSLEVLVRGLGAVLGISFVRFLGSEGSPLFSIPSLLLKFCGLFVIFTLLYHYLLFSKRRKSARILYVIIYLMVLSFSYLLRFEVVAVLGGTAALILNVSSGSNSDGEAGSLPPLESESSSASLNTYRNVIAAESEAEIYNRIRNLENMHYYNVPPQNNVGDYERLVREHFDQALDVDHYLEIWDNEYKEVQFLEKKALLQERLQDLMLNERNIALIMEMSPYTNVREEAYHFLQNKLEPVNDLSHAFQRHLMDGSLNYFVKQMNQHGGQSDLYREFYRYFTDEEFRRANGLPLP